MNTQHPFTAPMDRASELSGLSRSTLYRLAGEGRIRVLKLRRSSLVDMESVRAFINGLPEASIRPAPNSHVEKAAA